MKTLMNAIRLALFTGLLIAAFTTTALASKPSQAGKLTNVSGTFLCDCTNSEASCYCLGA